MPTIPDCPVVLEGERWSRERGAKLIAQLYGVGAELGEPWESTLQSGD